MAKETKSISVHPNDEQSTIELYQCFGWELQSSQEIFDRDSHQERKNDTLYSVTTTTNYVKLVFSRQTDIKNYRKLVELENRFDSVQTPSKKSAKLWFILGGAALLGGLGLSNAIGVAGTIIGIVGCIALGVLGIIKARKNSDEYFSADSAAREERARILNEASALL